MNLATKLLLVGAAIGIVSNILSLVMMDELIERQLPENVDVDIAGDTLATAIYGSAIFGLILAVGFAALFYFLLRKGSNATRIVYTVLAGLGLVFGLFNLGKLTPLLLIISLISYGITIAIIVLLYRPDSNAFYSAPR